MDGAAGSGRGWRVGVRDCDYLQTLDPSEMARIAGVHWKPITHCGRSNHGVVSASGDLATISPQRGGDLSECPGCNSVERDRVEISFGPLQGA